MEAQITADELALLAWFHENAVGYHETCAELPTTVIRATGIQPADLVKIVSFLAGWGLLGATLIDNNSTGSRRPEPALRRIWFTSAGENYMRVLESQPGIAQRLTLAVLRKVEDVAVKVGGAVLAEVVKAKMAGTA